MLMDIVIEEIGYVEMLVIMVVCLLEGVFVED